MKRFTVKKKLHIRHAFIALIAFSAFIAIFIFSVSTVGNNNDTRQEELLTSALERDIMHCYALEGFYPPSLDYIEDKYGLIYDKDKYIIDYRPIGNNIYPNLAIIRKGDTNEQ